MNSRLSLALVSLLIVLFSTSVYSQLSPKAWLALAWKDSMYRNKQALTDFRLQHPMTQPWLDKIELRTATNDFNIKQQEYSLRFFGSDPTEINFRKKLEPFDILYYRQLKEDALHDALVRRYRILLESYWIIKQDSLIREQQVLHKKKTNYLESLFQNQLDAEFKDLIQAYRKNEKINMEADNVERSKQLFKLKSGSIKQEDQIEISDFEWITPDQIRLVINQEHIPIAISSSYSRLIQNLSKTELENNRLKSSTWDILDFVQARWRNNNNDELIKEKVSIGAGFRLPYSGGKRREQNQLALEKIQIEGEINQYEEEYQIKLSDLKLELSTLLNQLEGEKQQLNTFSNKFKQPAILTNPLLRPQDLILIDETILDWKEEMFQLEKKIMEKYMEFLEHSRLISQAPYQNYLQKNLEKILD